MQRWLVGKKGASEKSAFAWRTFPCVRVTVMQLRERAPTESMKIKPGRPSAGGFTPLYLEVKDARECRDTSCTSLLPDTPLERIWNAHCGIAFGLDAPLFSSPCDPLHLATSPLLSSVPSNLGRWKKETQHDDNFFIT